MHEQAYHTKHWLAFYVKPRHEKKVAERLNRAGTELFCPMVSIRVRWSDRWKKIQKPLSITMPRSLLSRYKTVGK